MIAKQSLLILGVLLGGFASSIYYLHGYSLLVLSLWAVSIFLCGIFFFVNANGKSAISLPKSSELIPIGLLILTFAPIYLLNLYNVPLQVNTDEIATMEFEKILTDQRTPDLLGVSNYFGFPSFIFIVLGWLGKALGGINLVNMRTIHALSGLTIIILTYVFFRTFTAMFYAAGAAIIVGSNHALLAISRMAIRDNSGLLVELSALTLLFYGLQKKSPFVAFLGGVVTGLSFYTYFPSRITIILWLSFVAALALLFKSKIELNDLRRLAFVSLLGFLLVVAPIGVDSLRGSSESLDYAREQLLVFPEGRAFQQSWVGAGSTAEGVKINIVQGIGTFNNNVSDHANIYVNPGHSFVDPATGVLIWIGLAFTSLQIVFRSRKRVEDFLMIGSFLLLWLTFAFLINKAPAYTRLLVILPFVAYLAFEGLKTISNMAAALVGKVRPEASPNIVRTAVICLGLSAIVIWNLTIYGDFVQEGFAKGDDVGGTARYVESRRDIHNYSFYLAASNEYPYYSWGEPWQWEGWVGFFAADDHRVQVLSPKDFVDEIGDPPFTIFMGQNLWKESQFVLANLYPAYVVHSIKPDASLIAVEVTEESGG